MIGWLCEVVTWVLGGFTGNDSWGVPSIHGGEERFPRMRVVEVVVVKEEKRRYSNRCLSNGLITSELVQVGGA
jgi:hypothetical protein